MSNKLSQEMPEPTNQSYRNNKNKSKSIAQEMYGIQSPCETSLPFL